MLASETPPDEVFAQGLYHIPYGAATLQPALSALSELKQSIKQHALGDGIVQWTGPTTTTSTQAQNVDATFSAASLDRFNALAVSVQFTNYRLVVSYMGSARPQLDLPLASVGEVAKGRSGQGVFWVDFVSKLPFVVRIASDSEVIINNLARGAVVRIPRRVKELFAYTSAAAAAAAAPSPAALATMPPLDAGWGIYNPEAELSRMAKGGRRVAEFQLAPMHRGCFGTYPPYAMQPSAASDELLLDVARFRQNGRIPIISWFDGHGTGVLARCSQPLVGKDKRSKSDERLCSLLIGGAEAASHQQHRMAISAQQHADPAVSGAPPPAPPAGPPPSLLDTAEVPSPLVPAVAGTTAPSAVPLAAQQRMLHVIDCRSRAAAAANVAVGGGHELTAQYPRALSHFLSLPNIHKVRKAYANLRSVCAGAQGAVSTAAWGSAKDQHANFAARLSQTNWPTMTMKLLFASTRVADVLAAGDSALVHCTDGWDRTSQVCALAMMQLDPYYRTIGGFCVLIEQEFLRAGHRFVDRCGADSSHHVVSVESAAAAAGSGGGGGGTASKVSSLLQRVQKSIGDVDSDDEDADDVEAAGGASATDANNGVDAQRSIKPETSPVLVQFLDAVYQMLRMYPQAFEFTPAFLRLIGDAAYNGRFGTFLGNTHRSRHEAQRHASGAATVTSRPSASAAASTPSLWGHVANRLREEALDAQECPNIGDSSARTNDGSSSSPPRRRPPIPASERLLNPFFRPVGETDEQRYARQMSYYGFPSEIVGAFDNSSNGPTRSPPPPAAQIVVDDSTRRVPMAPAQVASRIVLSFHSKRYQFWAAWFLRTDFDRPADITSAAALLGCEHGGTGLEAVETPGYDPHVALMARAAEACRRVLHSQQQQQQQQRSRTQDDTTTSVLSLFPTALADAGEFRRWNTVPQLSAAIVASAASAGGGEGRSTPPAEDGHATPGGGGAAMLTPGFGADVTGSCDPAAAAGGGPLAGALCEDESDVRENSSVFFIPREDAAMCYVCEAGFSLWSRRHTCRMCARSVCGKCGGYYAALDRGEIALKEEKNLAGQRMRICHNCHTRWRTKGAAAAAAAAQKQQQQQQQLAFGNEPALYTGGNVAVAGPPSSQQQLPQWDRQPALQGPPMPPPSLFDETVAAVGGGGGGGGGGRAAPTAPAAPMPPPAIQGSPTSSVPPPLPASPLQEQHQQPASWSTVSIAPTPPAGTTPASAIDEDPATAFARAVAHVSPGLAGSTTGGDRPPWEESSEPPPMSPK